MSRTAPVVVFAVTVFMGCPGLAGTLDRKADEVIQRSRTTKATYSVYSWRSMEGSPGDWAAEFNRGDLHRVENSINRIVADCVKMTGAAFDLATGNVDRGAWAAKAACGIQSLKAPLRTKWMGRVETPFGTADRVLITDDVSDRTYDVLENGVLVASTYHRISDDLLVLNKASAVSNTLPAGDIFSEASLQESIVPDQYKVEPKP